MGAGRSLEAAYRLSGSLPGGTWTFVLDGICLESVDVRFELLHRPAGGDERELVAFGRHFDPLDSGEYQAQPFEHQEELDGVDSADGDLLVLRYTGDGSDLMMAWIPNGDGPLTGGRIPYLDLP
ncbi:MAG TPA: hypothetical protein VFU21_24865 [Kofleriaceae bacterium]|nr:hypothetical protein [Kofleriaceae bacterium]